MQVKKQMSIKRSPSSAGFRGWWLLIFLVLSAAVSSAANASDIDDPGLWIDPDGINGQLVICGGGTLPESVRKEFVERAGGADARILVVPTASRKADESASEKWLESWAPFQVSSLEVLHTRSKETADSEEFNQKIAEATGVWFSGGSQSLIAEAYVGTAAEDSLHKLLARGGIIGGTSAGAAIMSRTMIASGLPVPVIKEGLGLLPGVIIDQHFSVRKRLPRLQSAVKDHPELVGMGIDESTAVFVKGRMLTVVGEGEVSLVWARSPVHQEEILTLGNRRVADLTAMRRTALDRVRHASFPAHDVGSPKVARGSLVIVGGGGMPRSVVDEFVKLAGGENARIVVLPTAVEDAIARRTGVPSFLKDETVADIKVLPQRSREEVESEEFLEALKDATGVWFGGGRQWRFVDAYANTKAVKAMHEVLKRGGVIGGSSAGASIQAAYMARGNPLGNREIMARGYERGLGFLRGVAIDQHFTQRRRGRDMTRLVDAYPKLLGIGIDEATAIIVQGAKARVIGRNDVYFMQGGDKAITDQVSAGGQFDLARREVLDTGTASEKVEEKKSTAIGVDGRQDQE